MEFLSQRRMALEQAIDYTDDIVASRRLGATGSSAVQLAKVSGLEGLVAKNATAACREGRSNAWL